MGNLSQAQRSATFTNATWKFPMQKRKNTFSKGRVEVFEAFEMDHHALQMCIPYLYGRNGCRFLLANDKNDHQQQMLKPGSMMGWSCKSAVGKGHWHFCYGSINAERSNDISERYAACKDASFPFPHTTKSKNKWNHYQVVKVLLSNILEWIAFWEKYRNWMHQWQIKWMGKHGARWVDITSKRNKNR